MPHTAAHSATQALAAALLLQSAAAFQIWMTTNQFPDQLIRQADDWAEAKSLVEGIVGMGAPHPTDPMPNSVESGRRRGKFMQSFGDVPRVLEQPWRTWDAAQGTDIIDMHKELGFDADELFLWGGDASQPPQIDMTLSTAQLDKVAASPDFQEALILVMSFGRGLEDKDLITVRPPPACMYVQALRTVGCCACVLAVCCVGDAGVCVLCGLWCAR